jgi:uncharacterized protein YdhG (YjbR/CyaY superfamily)
MADKFATVDDYISSFPEDVQAVLEQVRRTIHRAVPRAGETISYQIPTITLDGKYLVYFAGWKQHISLYPLPDMDEGLEQEIAPYKAGKGTVRFPLEEPIPHDLIKKLVALLVQHRTRQ